MPGVVADYVAREARDKEEYDRDYESFGRFRAMAELEPDYERQAGPVGFNRTFDTHRGTAQPDRLKPAHQLTSQEIVAEARELHSHFKQLSEQYNQASAVQRPQLREEMEPLVDRERALRQEYTGRATQELRIDRPPEQQLEYSR
jgi:hypothetical protein